MDAPQSMNYADARPLIRTGDCIQVVTAHSWLGRFTKWITRKPYVHSGMAYWLGGALWMVEINGGRNHAIPMSQLAAVEFDVYDAPPGLVDVEGAIMLALREVIPYGFASFVLVGLLALLRSKRFVHWRRIMQCAGFVEWIYELAGWPEHNRQISPGGLADMLGGVPRIRVRPTTNNTERE